MLLKKVKLNISRHICPLTRKSSLHKSMLFEIIVFLNKIFTAETEEQMNYCV